MAEICFDKVKKRFGTHLVIPCLDLTVADGEFVVLVGPSGCGKTTTLQIIGGLEPVSDGRLLIGGRDVTHLPPKDRNISMVFQSYALFPHMNVRDNIGFGLKIRRTPKSDMEKMIGDVARRLRIDEYLDRLPKALSGGQRQRVALARAMVRRPDVFLMDEPLSNLDAKLRVEARSFLSKIHHELGITTVYVTHDQSEAMTMGSRIVVMKEGVIQQAAPPIEVYRHPANRFVAGFIGSPSMNFFDLDIDDNTLIDASVGFRLSLPRQRMGEISATTGRRVVLGVRPENLHILPRETEEANRMAFKIDVCQHLGNETLLDVMAGEHRAIVRAGAEDDTSEGERRSFRIDMDQVHFFHPETGQNLAFQ